MLWRDRYVKSRTSRDTHRVDGLQERTRTMEVMAFLVGAAARLNPASAEAATAWPRETQLAEETDRLKEPQAQPRNWTGHWAVAKYL